MLAEYAGIITLFTMTSGFLIVMILLSIFLGPQNKTVTKQEPFECGSIPVGDANSQRFNVRYYLVAMVFILFDVEIIFMYPWAVEILELGKSGFMAMLGFIAVLTVGLAYVWRTGVLDWNDQKPS